MSISFGIQDSEGRPVQTNDFIRQWGGWSHCDVFGVFATVLYNVASFLAESGHRKYKVSGVYVNLSQRKFIIRKVFTASVSM